MIRLVCEASDLAKALGNALAFLPAASNVKAAHILISPDRIYTAGTDGYAAGSDCLPIRDYEGPEWDTALLVSKADLTIIERVAREGKRTPAVVSFTDGTLTVESYGSSGTAEVLDIPQNLELYETLAGIINDAEGRPPVIPGVLCLNPALLSRFAKVKADNGDRMADLYMTDRYAPVLIKIGPTFKGLVMPIERVGHAEHVGADGLW